jgi:hypothetical protein
MMRLIISFLLLLAFCGISFPQKRNCQCRKATAEDKTIWGHIADEYEEERPVKRIHGVVRDVFEEPSYETLVEVFPDDGTDKTPTSDSHERLVQGMLRIG